jgi:hypothetical protein
MEYTCSIAMSNGEARGLDGFLAMTSHETMTATNANGMRTPQTGDGTSGMGQLPVPDIAAAVRDGMGSAEPPGIPSR